MSKICEREGCGNLVPYPRRKYCCDECGKIDNRRRAKLMAGPIVRANPQRKMRMCLMCGKEFWSDGPGYRRCEKCRKSLSSSASPAVLPHRIPGSGRRLVEKLALENEMENM